MKRLSLLVCALLLSASQMEGAEQQAKTSKPVSYYRDIRPLFQQHCQGCHQPARDRGGYVMTSHADLLKEGDSGQAGIVPGKPEKSYLMDQIIPHKGKPAAMPKGKPALLASQVKLIRTWIAEGAQDDTPASARDVVDAKHPPIYESPPVITAIAFSPDGSLLAVSGHHEVLLHSVPAPNAPPTNGGQLEGRLIGLAERIQSLAFAPDGERLAVAGGSPGRFGEVQVWDLVPRRRLRVSATFTYDTLYGVSWAHDGSKVAFGCADKTLRAIDANTGKQVLFQGAHNDWVLDTVFSRDSSYLVSVSRDRSMKLTAVSTQRFIDNITSITPGALKGGLMAVDRNPEKHNNKVKYSAKVKGVDKSEKWYDELIVGGADGVPRLYKMHRTTKRVIGDDANRLREYPGMPGRIFALRFSPDGSHFAAGSSSNGVGAVRIYETKTGKVKASMQAKVGPIYALAYHPTGKQLAVAGFDGLVWYVDPATGKVLRKFVPVPLTGKSGNK